MSTQDKIAAELGEIRLRLEGAAPPEPGELETLLVRLEVLRLQMEAVHKEGEAALTISTAILQELEAENKLRGLSE